jgi:glycosyltransferase involved in cell wall biosynthesis
VIIESWRAQYPARLYPGQQTVDVPEGAPYPRTRRRLAWYRPDGWLAEGRRLRPADLVVFAYLTPLQAPPYLAIMSRLGRTPKTAVICHNVLPHERRPGDVALTRALLRRADTVLTHSAAQAAQARELAPGTTVRTVTMPPHLPVLARGDDPPEPPASPSGGTHPPRPPLGGTHPPRPPLEGTHPPGPPLRLLFFGIVRPYKGLDVLLRALAQAPPQVTLTVAGEFWGDSTEMDNLIAELGLAGRVTVRPGYVPADQIPALFGAADALVMPYREATASQNAQLAFAHGVPVITTTAGALADQVHDGVDGLTCAPEDEKDLLRTLEEISDPETARRLRAGVRPVDPEPGWAAYLRVLLAG